MVKSVHKLQQQLQWRFSILSFVSWCKKSQLIWVIFYLNLARFSELWHLNVNVLLKFCDCMEAVPHEINICIYSSGRWSKPSSPACFPWSSISWMVAFSLTSNTAEPYVSSLHTSAVESSLSSVPPNRIVYTYFLLTYGYCEVKWLLWGNGYCEVKWLLWGNGYCEVMVTVR